MAKAMKKDKKSVADIQKYTQLTKAEIQVLLKISPNKTHRQINKQGRKD